MQRLNTFWIVTTKNACGVVLEVGRGKQRESFWYPVGGGWGWC
jgi:hypothetical protein